MEVVRSKGIDTTANRLIYHRRIHEGLNLVLYDPKLTKYFEVDINEERTQGSGTVVNKMKFKLKALNFGINISGERKFLISSLKPYQGLMYIIFWDLF